MGICRVVEGVYMCLGEWKDRWRKRKVLSFVEERV